MATYDEPTLLERALGHLSDDLYRAEERTRRAQLDLESAAKEVAHCRELEIKHKELKDQLESLGLKYPVSYLPQML